MSEWRLHTVEGDPARVATILPGSGYTAAAPLLEYARAALAARGWTVQVFEWLERPDSRAALTVYSDVVADVGRLARPSARQLVVGKSLGTLALPEAVSRGIPGAWLTPLLVSDAVPEVREAVSGLGSSGVPALLVGGTADPLWDGAVARASGATVLEIDGADHTLEVPAGWRQNLQILGQVTEAVDELAARVEG